MNTLIQFYPNTESRAVCHYSFGCQWRASSMNCSDQRNTLLINPICARPYIYIMFQYFLSEGSGNLGQRKGKCKRGPAEQQELGAEWRIDRFLWWSWLQPFFFLKKSSWQNAVSRVFNQEGLFKGLSTPDIRVRDEEGWKYVWGKETGETFHHLPANSTSERCKKSPKNPSTGQLTLYRLKLFYRSPPKRGLEL